MTSKNMFSMECYITHNLDEYEKQLDKVILYIQMLKNEIKELERIKLTIDFHTSEGQENTN
jgi:hypothetical protein